ncbi:hypothetical protein BDF22DRAFT_742399 [Syncephalis plumigaleata]|nr:hypothetical protein BDF22DRAFT_742399 [Syncephalis plumigaleata]
MDTQEVPGTLNGIEYLENSPDMQILRERSNAVHMQIVSNVMLLMLFLHNTQCSIKMVHLYSNKIAPWCCLISSAIGVIFFGVFTMLHHLPNGPSCIQVIWCSISCLTISTMAVNTVLLERAYLAHCRNRWVLILGVLLIAPAPILIYLNWIANRAIFSHTAACYADYPGYFPYVRAAVDAPPNIVFSLLFITVIYRQYCHYGGRCWARLAHDGILVMMLVITSNLICFIGNVTYVLGETTDYLYVIDWAVTTTLLVKNTKDMSISSRSTAPAVEKIPVQHRIGHVFPASIALTDIETDIETDMFATQKTNTLTYL